MRYTALTVAVLMLSWLPVSPAMAMGKAPSKEDLKMYRVNPDELLKSGLTEESFPSILEPKFETADKTPFTDQEMVLGVVIKGEARAYPIGILNYHELINDVVAGDPIAVTYSVLDDTGAVYSRRIGKDVATFGNSGEIFRSNPVYYDAGTRSYWSQAWGIAIKGPLVNTALTRVPAVRTTLGLWKKAYPATLVMAKKTGTTRNYFKYPYGDYYTNDRLLYPVPNLDKLKLHVKEHVTFVCENDGKVAHNAFSGPFRQFVDKEVRQKGFEAAPFGTRWIVALWDKSFESVRVYGTPEEATSLSDSQLTLKGGKKIALKNLKELPSSRAFAFVPQGLF